MFCPPGLDLALLVCLTETWTEKPVIGCHRITKLYALLRLVSLISAGVEHSHLGMFAISQTVSREHGDLQSSWKSFQGSEMGIFSTVTRYGHDALPWMCKTTLQ